MDALATPTLRSELRRGVSPYNLGVAFIASLIIAVVESALRRAGVIPLIASSDLAQALAVGATLFAAISAMHIAAHAYFGWRFERGVAALANGSVTRALRLLEIADRKGMEHYDEQGAVRRLVAKIRAGDFAR